ncbi:MAG: shikimate kinase [Clostridia bacterium]|nr:shikimate kinase [Clostridia bacterium]
MSNLILCGFMGCGKSTVGKRLAAQCGMTFVDTDRYLEQQLKTSISDFFAAEGEAAFRDRETAVCRTLGAEDGLVLATGGGAVLRDENVEALCRNGVIVWLRVGVDCVLERLRDDRTRPLLQREDKEQAVRALLTAREPLYARAAHVTVNAESDPQTVVTRILDALKATDFSPKCPC